MAATRRQLPAARHCRRRRATLAAATAAAAACCCCAALVVALSCVPPASALSGDDADWARVLAEHHANSTVLAPGLLQLHAHESEGGLLFPPPAAAAAAPRGRALRKADGEGAALLSSRRRALQAASDRWRDQGRYVVLRNPEMPDGRSSTGQVAIHAVLIPGSYRILIAGRNLPKQGPLSVPEPNVYGNVSTIFDAKAGTYEVSENYDTLFCTGHSHASDGTIVAAGGDAGRGYGWMKEGRDVVRLFSPSSMRWETLPGVKLSEYRWYPTQVQLPDDRVVIVSGFLDDPGVPTGKPAPSIDVFSYRERRIVARRSRYDLGKGFFTNVTPGYQLYPTVFLMPWTDPDAPGDYFLLFYTCRTGQVVRLTQNNDFQVLHTLPGLPVENVCAAFSAMGSAVMLPFKKKSTNGGGGEPASDDQPNQYGFEFVMFGGGSQGKGNKNGCAGECELPASPYVFRMAFPASPKEAIEGGRWPKSWQYSTSTAAYETMPSPRLFADAVLLPNGKVVVLNGAKKGMPAGTIEGGGLAKEPNYQALLYDPDLAPGRRFRELSSSSIHRFYHSNAMLLPSGDVWVAGSEHGPDCRADCKTNPAPPAQEYRAELFQPPYAFFPRPAILSVSDAQPRLGGEITVRYRPSVQGGKVTGASIMPPGARTHGLDMSARLVFLEAVSIAAGAGGGRGGSATFRLPSAASRVALPGWYMLWVLEGDVPAKEATWIQLRA